MADVITFDQRPAFTWRTFFTIWGLGVLGTVAILPYLFTLQGEALAATGMPIPLLIMGTLAQSAVLIAIATYVGLRLGARIGFKIIPTEPYIPLSIVLGASASLLIYVLDWLLIAYTSFEGFKNVHIPAWQGLLASLYGGITEEILLRLFFVTFLAWLLMRLFKETRPIPAGIAWSAIIAAAVLFGIGHLPAVAQIAPLTAIIAVRTIVLNAVGGIVFGWLYWKRGLIAAMVAHFSADIVLHVIAPLFLR